MKFPRHLDASHLPVERPQSFCHRVFLSRFQGIGNCPGLHGPWHQVLEGLGRAHAIGQSRGLRPGPEAQRPGVRDAGSSAEPKGSFSRKLLDPRRNRKSLPGTGATSVVVLRSPGVADLGRHDGRLDSGSELWCCGRDSRPREQVDGRQPGLQGYQAQIAGLGHRQGHGRPEPVPRRHGFGFYKRD